MAKTFTKYIKFTSVIMAKVGKGGIFQSCFFTIFLMSICCKVHCQSVDCKLILPPRHTPQFPVGWGDTLRHQLDRFEQGLFEWCIQNSRKKPLKWNHNQLLRSKYVVYESVFRFPDLICADQSTATSFFPNERVQPYITLKKCATHCPGIRSVRTQLRLKKKRGAFEVTHPY